MSPALKFLIGILAILVMGWLWHGPLGQGAAFVDRIEGEARRAVAATEVPGITVALGRHPLSRVATLSGPADAFQREGQGELKGLNDIVGETAGVSKVRWTDEPGRGGGIPLLAETLALDFVAFLLGIGLSWLFFGRPKKEGYL